VLQWLHALGRWHATRKYVRGLRGAIIDKETVYHYDQFSKQVQYPQTWGLVARLRPKWVQKPLKWLCKTLIGHEPSKTERGYAGDGNVDYWCRWCNQLLRGRVEEDPDGLELKRMFEELNTGEWKDKMGGTGMTQG
jgi:hypothetical protein